MLDIRLCRNNPEYKPFSSSLFTLAAKIHILFQIGEG